MHSWREHQRGGGRDDGLQAGASPFQGTLAYVLAVEFQQVIGDQDHRNFRENFGTQHFAADAPLHLRERQRRSILPGKNFAVDDGAFGELGAQRLQFGEAVRDQFFAARPEKSSPLAPDQLRANAIPFPFDLPAGRIAEIRDIAFQGIGEAEGIWTADVGIAGIGGNELAPEFGGGLPLSHEAMRHGFRSDAAGFGDRANDQALRDADAKFAGDELVPGEALAFVQLAPRLDQEAAARFVIGVAQGEEALFDPVVKRELAGGVGGRQEKGDGLGEIADRVVAVAEQPVGDAGFFDGPLGELARFEEPLGAAADQEVDGPGGVFGLSGGQVTLEGVDLGVGLGGLVERGVEFGEGFHSGRASGSGDDGCSPFAGSANSTATACLPCSCSQRTIGAM